MTRKSGGLMRNQCGWYVFCSDADAVGIIERFSEPDWRHCARCWCACNVLFKLETPTNEANISLDSPY